MLSAAKHLAAQRDRPFAAAQGDTGGQLRVMCIGWDLPTLVLKQPMNLETAHDDLCYEILWSRQDRLTAEQDTHVIKLKDSRFATEPGGVVDVRTVLHKRFIVVSILGFASIDRYIIERAASAA
jgi:hypothetical protein